MYLIGRLFFILRHACKYGWSRFSVLNLLLCWGLKPVQRKRQRAVLAFRVEFTWRNKSGFFCWIIELLAGLLKTSWSQKVRRSVVQSHWSRGEFLLALYIYLLSYLYFDLHHRTALFAIYIALMGSDLWPVQSPVTSIRFLKSNASLQPDSISWAAVPVPFQLSTFPFLSSKDCSSVLFQRNTFQVQGYLDSYLYPLMKADYVCSRLVDRCFCKFCPCLLIFSFRCHFIFRWYILDCLFYVKTLIPPWKQFTEFCFQRQGAQIKTFLRVKTIDRLKSSYKFAYFFFGGVKSFYFPRLRKKNKRRSFLSRFHENTADCFKDSRKLIHYFFET